MIHADKIARARERALEPIKKATIRKVMARSYGLQRKLLIKAPENRTRIEVNYNLSQAIKITLILVRISMSDAFLIFLYSALAAAEDPERPLAASSSSEIST